MEKPGNGRRERSHARRVVVARGWWRFEEAA
jgi:hypothetical protein